MMGIKKTSSIKNKFFDQKSHSRLEEKIPHPEDHEMEVEEEKDTIDYDMKIDEEMHSVQEMDIEVTDQSDTPEEDMFEEKDVLEDVRSKRADRRKTILKELEVCDLLELRNPQCVAEYASCIYEQMRKEEINFLIKKNFLESTQIKEKHRRKLIEWLSDFS
jgi:hypothetical protein